MGRPAAVKNCCWLKLIDLFCTERTGLEADGQIREPAKKHKLIINEQHWNERDTGDPTEWLNNANFLYTEEWCWSLCTSHCTRHNLHWQCFRKCFRRRHRHLQLQTAQTNVLFHLQPCNRRFSCWDRLYSVLHCIFTRSRLAAVVHLVQVARSFHLTEFERVSYDIVLGQLGSVSGHNRPFEVRTCSRLTATLSFIGHKFVLSMESME